MVERRGEGWKLLTPYPHKYYDRCDNYGSVANGLITNEDLVVLYCGGVGSTLVASYKYDA